MNVIMITGGVRSGKSRYAESRAAGVAGAAVTFVATATPSDDEMRRRIDRHRTDRPSEWAVVEPPARPASAISEARTRLVLLDCFTLHAARMLEESGAADEGAAHDAIAEAADEIVVAANARAGTLLIVTNEVGFSVHPATNLGRWFQDGLGRANQRIAERADEVVLVVSGIPLVLKRATIVA